MTVEDRLIRVAQLREQILQMSGARFNRARETDLLPRQVIEDRAAALNQLGIEPAILLDHRLGNPGKERLM